MLNKKLSLMAIAVIAAAAFAPTAHAKPRPGSPTPSSSANVGNGYISNTSGPNNAAAAVYVDFDGKYISEFSAASAFGGSSAAAIATGYEAVASGSNSSEGYVQVGERQRGNPEHTIYVDFGQPGS